MDIQTYIAKSIKKRREELGISRYDLERMSGITYNQLLNIERGKSTTTRLLDKIFTVLGMKFTIKTKNADETGDN